MEDTFGHNFIKQFKYISFKQMSGFYLRDKVNIYKEYVCKKCCLEIITSKHSILILDEVGYGYKKLDITCDEVIINNLLE